MKRIIPILLLAGLCLPVLFERCKKPESDPVTPGGKSLYFVTNDASNKGYLGVMELATEKVDLLALPTAMGSLAIDPTNNKVIYALEYVNSNWLPCLYKITLK